MSCEGQLNPPVQRRTASPFSRTAGEPQSGHLSGILNGRSAPVLRLATTETTSGITSPARSSSTKSPIRMFFSYNWSSLCSVARDTIVPPTNTGSRHATGVRAPVRPTWTMISHRRVITRSAGNLKAIECFGAFALFPSCICSTNELTLSTIPSMSYGRSWRFLVHCAQLWMALVMLQRS